MGAAKRGQLPTQLEVDTMEKLCRGMTPKRIARLENVKPNAIRTRMWRVGIKLGTRGHIQTIMVAHLRGLISMDPLS